jgi:hypothetical protein
MENGVRMRRAGKASKFRIEIMDADGKNRRELELPGITLLQLFQPEWR